MRPSALLAVLASMLLLPLLAGCSSSADGDGAAKAGTGVAAPEPEDGILTGTLTAAAPSVDLELPVKAEGHGRLAVALSMGRPVPESRLTVYVTGPSGQKAEGSTVPFLYVFPGTRPTLSFESPEMGSWTAHVELSGATADYVVHWCADDQDAQGPSDNFACHHY